MSSSTSTSTLTHTLFLWPQSLFPRRITYLLLASGLLPSASALFTSLPHPCPSAPTLTIRLIDLDPVADEWVCSDPSDPKPDTKSLPALRITDSTTNTTRWIHESTSMLLYLASTFPSKTYPMVSQDPIDLAKTVDLLALANEVIMWSGVHARHIDPNSLGYSGMEPEQQSKGAARDGVRMCRERLVRLQEWVDESGSASGIGDEGLEKSGLLTPGLQEGPGVVDFALMAWVRYLEVGRGWDAFDDERLKGLGEWKKRMEGLSWWKELEGDERMKHPDFLVDIGALIIKDD